MATEDRWLRVVEGGPANQPLGTLQGYEFHNFVVPPHNLFPCPTPPVDGVGGGAARGFTADNAEVREQSCPLRSGGRGYAASTRPVGPGARWAYCSYSPSSVFTDTCPRVGGLGKEGRPLRALEPKWPQRTDGSE